MTKIAFIGVGKIGQTIAYSTVFDDLAEEYVFYDIIPELPEKFEHEVRHALASRGLKASVMGTNSLADVNGMDLVVITAGKPRKPGMSRRDLFVDNAKIMEGFAREIPGRNPDALYLMVSNPVDMMASVFQSLSGKFTISAGDQVETMRMRSFVAKKLGVPVNQVDGYVGGEHGEDAVVLWSTVKVKGRPTGDGLNRGEVEDYVKKIPGEIIRVMGGTTWGPGTIIKDIIRSFVRNENRVMSIAMPREFEGDMIHVSVPTVVGSSIGPTLESTLSEEDRARLENSFKSFHRAFRENMKSFRGM